MTVDGKQPHVLVVDHSPEILSLIRDLLEEELLRVSTCSDGDVDLDELARIAPDLILLDPTSCPAQGLLHHLIGDARSLQIPIVLCTGAMREEVDAMQESLGAVAPSIVRKPFDIDHLVRVVQAELGLTSEPENLSPPSQELKN